MSNTAYKKEILKFNNETNNYHVLDDDMHKTIDAYNKNIKSAQTMLSYIPHQSPSNKIRIVSYDVRYFTSVDNTPTIDHLVDTLLEYTPHVICLQEFSLGNNKYYNTEELKYMFIENFDRLLDSYYVISVCVYPPAFYTTIYGNAILMNKKYVNNIKNISDPSYTNFIKDTLCNDLIASQNKCFMNQQIFNYDNIPPLKNNTYNKIGTVKYREQTNENKCFIKVTLPQFDLICVHLDATFIDYRIKQLKQINDTITRPTIIIGDFNFFDLNDFLVTINIMYGKYIFSTNDRNKLQLEYQKIFSDVDIKITHAIKENLNTPLHQFMKDNIPEHIRQLQNDDFIITIYYLKEIVTTDTNKLLKLLDLLKIYLTLSDIKIFYEDPVKIPNDVKIKQIMAKITSLENYFKNRSGSIFNNTEIKYCNYPLQWDRIDNVNSMNLSQWSGTRVDMAFFAKFSSDIIYNQYLLPIDIKKGSDHLPLILDFQIDDNVLLSSLEIPKIEIAERKKVKISRQNPCADVPPLKQILGDSLDDVIEIFKKPLYNAQPCTNESFDWYIDGHFTKLNDPYLTSGTSDQMLGRKGIYISQNISYVKNIVQKLKQVNLMSLYSSSNGIYYSYLLHIFNYIGPNIDSLIVGLGDTWHDNFYETCYDKRADILSGDIDTLAKETVPDIFKIPPKNVQAYLQLKELKISCDILDSFNGKDWWKNDIVNSSPYTINEELLNNLSFKLLTLIGTKHVDEQEMKAELKTAYIVLLNTIDYINKASLKKYQKTFIKNIENTRFEISGSNNKGEYTLSYIINLNDYGINQAGGKTDTRYKYTENKHDYIFLKMNK